MIRQKCLDKSDRLSQSYVYKKIKGVKLTNGLIINKTKGQKKIYYNIYYK